MNYILAEFLGTFFLIYIILATGNAFAIGAALTVIILLTTASGGHINPAVTLTMTAAGKIPLSKTGYYILAQVIGGLTALGVYNLTHKSKK